MNQATKSKYRPVLTELQIMHIITLAKEDIMSPVSKDYEVSISLLSSLSPFAAKIGNAGIQAAYTGQPTHQQKLVESLGGTLVPEGISKEDYWEECYQKLLLTGTAALSLQEIKAAQEHKYLNGLMTPEEVEQFEGTINHG